MTNTRTVEAVLPKSIYLALKQAAERRNQTEMELLIEAVQAYLERLAKIDPLLGLFADEPDLIDSIVMDIMQKREHTPLRLARMTGG